jgi:hypothetical protein
MEGFFRDLRYTVRNMGRSPGLAAGYLPARRAALVDPARALRL